MGLTWKCGWALTVAGVGAGAGASVLATPAKPFSSLGLATEVAGSFAKLKYDEDETSAEAALTNPGVLAAGTFVLTGWLGWLWSAECVAPNATGLGLAAAGTARETLAGIEVAVVLTAVPDVKEPIDLFPKTKKKKAMTNMRQYVWELKISNKIRNFFCFF